MQKNIKSTQDNVRPPDTIGYFLTKVLAAASRISEGKSQNSSEDLNIVKLNLYKAYVIDPNNKLVQDLMGRDKFNLDIKTLEDFAGQYYSSQTNNQQPSARLGQPPVRPPRR